MTETSLSPEASTLDSDTDNEATLDDSPDAATVARSRATDRKTLYCPSCHSRFLNASEECSACHVKLVGVQPRDVSLFRPLIDVPFVLAAMLFYFGYDRLNGEAQSFGLIFLILGFATLVTFRAIGYAEWLGRR